MYPEKDERRGAQGHWYSFSLNYYFIEMYQKKSTFTNIILLYSET